MKIVILISLLVLNLFADKLLVINSNSNIQKYKSVEKSFIENYKGSYEILDLSNLSQKEIKDYLYDEYPDTIYAIGAKAYIYSNMYLPEKTIFFSSIVNYQRFEMSDDRYGVATELHEGMKLTLIKSLFNKTKSISIVYSDFTEDLYNSFKNYAPLLGLEIKGKKISRSGELDKAFIEKSDALLLISDPILLKNEKNVIKLFEDMEKLKKPVFAYHKLFIDFGATLVISADNPTIGRQVSLMVNRHNKKKEFKKIQIPIGTNVIFNKKQADKIGLSYDKKGLSVVNEVIE